MPTLLRSITLATLALASGMAAAHDGGVTAEGCHHDAKGYHCHRGVASRPSTVQAVAPDRPGSSLDDSSGESARRNCTTAMLACGSIEETAHGTGPLRAMGEIGEEQRGTKALLEAGGPGLLVVLAVLFVLSLHTILGVHRRRSWRRNRLGSKASGCCCRSGADPNSPRRIRWCDASPRTD